MTLFARSIMALFLVVLTTSCQGVFGRHLDIEIDEVPVYPNAQNVMRESHDPESGAEYIYTWTFTTSDTPDDVWQYYVDELGRKWGFEDIPARQFDDHTLGVTSCPLYWMTMSSAPVDGEIYSIVIKFVKEYCL